LSGTSVTPKGTTIPAGDEWAKKLNDRERLFVEGYLQTLSKKQAALHAGYTYESARRHSYTVFNRPHVREAIELAMHARSGITKTWVLDQIVELAQTRATDLFEWNTITGLRLKSSDEIEPEHIGAVAEIEETTTYDKKGNKTVTVKIKTHSRQQALNTLAKIVRLNVNVNEISGPNGGPVEVTDHRARITDRLNAIAKRQAPDNDGASGSAE
jgi:phage terminase small subunit